MNRTTYSCDGGVELITVTQDEQWIRKFFSWI